MSQLIFRQLFEKESSTYTYLLADNQSREAVIIDPVDETKDRDISIIEELDLDLKYIIETHIHADHITSSCPLKNRFKDAKIVLAKGNPVNCADLFLENDEIINFGNFELKGIKTPGHTNGCMTYSIEDMLFTGDALLIRSCGRCDFQEGSSANLFESLTKLFSFPDATKVFPAHDYSGRTMSTILEEKKYNEMIGGNIDKKTFMDRVDNMQLSLPKKIHIAVPANQSCGINLY
jgi:sulfur dioxygenase